MERANALDALRLSALVHHHQRLLESINLSDIVDHLEDIVGQHELETLFLSSTTNQQKVQCLIDILSTGSQAQFNRFVALLRDHGNAQLAHSLDAYQLEADDADEQRCSDAVVRELLELDLRPTAAHSSGTEDSCDGVRTQSEETIQSATVNPDGLISVGTITYNPNDRLGRGVYRGTYGGRQVAVKQVDAKDFKLVYSEVESLKITDEDYQHQHVIRYFNMESTSDSHYIALELCQGTLVDYLKTAGFDRGSLDPITLLQQTINGLAHLHKLQIVHRDVKPQNVLISRRGAHGQIRAMISDFGLCKKLDAGQHSVSLGPSGVVGTLGWGIAPEMLKEDSQRTAWTKAVDIFSLGEVFYYVLSNGKHPFGDAPDSCYLDRLTNIRDGTFTLDGLNDLEDSCLAKSLITKMIDNDPPKRPSAAQTMADPLFWSKGKKLEFIQEVSDRIEKLPVDDALMVRLRTDAAMVVKNDWLQHIHEDLRANLCASRYRKYDGTSVRDLLRAMRNMKHHYRDLRDVKVKKLFGSVPDGIVAYFTGRRCFPDLLPHVHRCLEYCKNEEIFRKYYATDE